MFVCPTVEDQLAFLIREGAQFQPSRFAPKEGVVLNDLNRSPVRNGRRFLREGLNALDVSLDLDVSLHGASN